MATIIEVMKPHGNDIACCHPNMFTFDLFKYAISRRGYEFLRCLWWFHPWKERKNIRFLILGFAIEPSSPLKKKGWAQPTPKFITTQRVGYNGRTGGGGYVHIWFHSQHLLLDHIRNCLEPGYQLWITQTVVSSLIVILDMQSWRGVSCKMYLAL